MTPATNISQKRVRRAKILFRGLVSALSMFALAVAAIAPADASAPPPEIRAAGCCCGDDTGNNAPDGCASAPCPCPQPCPKASAPSPLAAVLSPGAFLPSPGTARAPLSSDLSAPARSLRPPTPPPRAGS